jgi:hypothetical protein
LTRRLFGSLNGKSPAIQTKRIHHITVFSANIQRSRLTGATAFTGEQARSPVTSKFFPHFTGAEMRPERAPAGDPFMDEIKRTGIPVSVDVQHIVETTSSIPVSH